MAASRMRTASRSISTFSKLFARPGYPPSIRYREDVLPEIPRLTEEPEYPPLLPPLHGKSEESQNYRLQLFINNVKEASTVSPNEMINLLKKRQLFHHQIGISGSHPGFLPHRKYITKTEIVHELPPRLTSLIESDMVQTEANEILEFVKKLVHFDSESMYRHKKFKPMQYSAKAHHFVHNLFPALVGHLSSKYPHLARSETDFDVSINSFWHHGSEDFLQYNGKAAFSVRCEEPLAEYVDINDGLCRTEVEEWPWDPRFISVFKKHQTPLCFPGFKFGSKHVHAHTQVYTPLLSDKRLKEFGMYKEYLDGIGTTTGFAWLNALAMYQGYCFWNDISRPMTAQIIYTNGRMFSFYCYQLNTIGLKKDPVTIPSPLTNLCWQKVDIPLYYDFKDGEVRDFNIETLKILLAFLMNQPNRQITQTAKTNAETKV